MARLLVVEDEPNMLRLIEMHLRADSHAMVLTSSLQEGLAALESQDFDVVLADQKLTDGEGLSIVHSLAQRGSTTATVMLTAHGSVELAVEAMRMGAFDFLSKPFASDNLRAVIKRAAQHSSLRRENALLRSAVGTLGRGGELRGSSQPMRQLRELIVRVGPSEATVLITGETGTGKELVARELHRASNRAERPMISVNCAAFSETLLESELFGHEKGAFTGADRMRSGLFETAHKGTLFLDEAGEMSPSAQAKLLRVLAEGKITRVGSSLSRDVDVRVLVATHRDLLKEVAAGRFRQDLYYRLAIVPLAVPPLRARKDDIEELSTYLLSAIVKDLKTGKRTLSSDVLTALISYDFPGNVRELRNILERACILCSDPEIGWIDLPALESAGMSGEVTHSSQHAAAYNLRQYLAQTEWAAIQAMLRRTGGAKAEAARRLGLSKSDLTYKLAKYTRENDSGPKER